MNDILNRRFEYPTLYAKNNAGAILEWDIIVEGNSYWTVTGQRGGRKVTSKPSIATGKNSGKANSTTDNEQAIAEAESKWIKKLKSGGYWEDIKDVDKPLLFIEPMLAYPLYSKKTKKVKNKVTGEITEITQLIDRTEYIIFPTMLDRKYNGMRQVTSAMGPFSRKGERVKTAPHIYTALIPLFNDIPELVLDGELYNHDYRHKLNELISIVRTTADHKITPELIEESERVVKYYVYDGYGFTLPENITFKNYVIGASSPVGSMITLQAGTEITEDTPNQWRREALKVLLKNIQYVVVVEYDSVPTMDEVLKLYGEHLADGYEGSIVRNASAPYQHVRTNDLIKVKPYEDMEVVILEIIDPGSGNWGGTAKTASVRMSNGKVFDATFKGGRETLAKILSEKDKWIGQTVTITYNGWTGKGTPNYAQIDPNNCFKGDR